MKRLLVLLLAGCLIGSFALAGCKPKVIDTKDDNVVEDEIDDTAVENDEETIEDDVEETPDVEVTQEDETETETDNEEAEEGANTIDTSDVEVTADWKTYQFVVNGVTLFLPCSYAELKEATGWSMKSSDEKSYLEGGYYTWLNLYSADEELVATVDILNGTDGDLLYTDCPITAISQNEYKVTSQKAIPIVFPGGLVAGQEITIEQLIALFGEPQDTHEYTDEESDYWSNTYRWQEYEDYGSFNYLKITITNGIIDDITLDRRSYE